MHHSLITWKKTSQDIHQTSKKNLLWILNLLLFLQLRRKKRNAVAKGSVMDQFTSPTVPVLHGEAVLGLSRAGVDAELKYHTQTADVNLNNL